MISIQPTALLSSSRCSLLSFPWPFYFHCGAAERKRHERRLCIWMAVHRPRVQPFDRSKSNRKAVIADGTAKSLENSVKWPNDKGKMTWRGSAANSSEVKTLRELQCLGEADMRSVHQKAVSAVRAATTNGRDINASLIIYDHASLLDHLQCRLRNRIKRGDRLGVRRVGLLRHNQLGKLRGNINIGCLNRTAGNCAPSTSSSHSDHCRA